LVKVADEELRRFPGPWEVRAMRSNIEKDGERRATRTAIIQLMPLAIFDSGITQFGGREVDAAGHGDIK
jgi:hypothetical protein